MPGALPRLFRHSWGFAAATLGTLAATLAGAAALFRHIGSDGVHSTGHCAPPVPDGGEIYCRLGIALAQIAGGLNLLAIAAGAAAFFAAWHWHAHRRDDSPFGSDGGGGDGDHGGGGDGD